MKTLRLYFALALIGLWTMSAFAQTASELEFWNRTVAEKSLPEIAELISGPTAAEWPEIKSIYSVQKLSGERRVVADNALKLAQAMHGKIEREIRSATPKAGLNPLNYLRLAQAFQDAGGYGNLLLADGLRRVAILQFTDLLINGNRSVGEVREQVNRVQIPEIDIRKFLIGLASEDPALSEDGSKLAKITDAQNAFLALHTAELGDASVLLGKTYNQLVDNPSAAALLMRMMGTKMLYDVSLKGLIVFLEQGGTYLELNPADVRPFKKRMAGKEQDFSFPEFDVRYLRGSDIQTLFDLHRDPSKKEAFLNAALK